MGNPIKAAFKKDGFVHLSKVILVECALVAASVICGREWEEKHELYYLVASIINILLFVGTICMAHIHSFLMGGLCAFRKIDEILFGENEDEQTPDK